MFEKICKSVRPDVFHFVPRKGSSDFLYWRRVIRMSALCHDLGHLPFSHVAEKDLLGAFGHEHWTLKVIDSSYMASVWNKLRKCPGCMEELVERDIVEDIKKISVGERNWKEVTGNAFTPWERIVSEVITGDFFGADRIDYLIRDAKSTGVAYGLFDYHQLIESLRILPSVDRGADELQLGIDESHIVPISMMVETFSGKRVAANAPIIGADVFTQTAGIHADGDQKGGLYKSKLGPERFSRKHSYALGKMSGKASLKKNLEQLELDLSEEDQKKVLDRIVRLGDSKQTITADDLPFIIADVLASKEYQHIKLLNCSITSGFNLESTVSLRVSINGKEHVASGFGNGGYDAFIHAIEKVLVLHNYSLPRLADYEVRIPKGGLTSALTECVITWDCDGDIRKTRGVHANQVFAAVLATLRIINMQLHELNAQQS